MVINVTAFLSVGVSAREHDEVAVAHDHLRGTYSCLPLHQLPCLTRSLTTVS